MATAHRIAPSAAALLILFCGFTMGTSRLARADEASASGMNDPDPDTEVARRHFAAGGAAYEQGDYATALREFERARLAKPLPAFDYNIARCYDRLERYREAISAYERFVAAASPGEDTTEPQERIRVLRARLAELAPQPAAPGKTLPASLTLNRSPSRRPSVVGPALLAAATGAIAVVGLGLYLSVYPAYQDLERQCAPHCAPSRWSGLEQRERAGIGLVIACGALAVGNVVWWSLRPRRALVGLAPESTAVISGMARP
jgi:tetratricopeptide (TPR) repeat protein